MAQRIGAAGLFLASVIYEARDAVANDLNGFDIVGFRLGQSQDEVKSVATEKLEDATSEPLRRRLMLGSFAIDDVLFGVKIKDGKNTSWYNTPNKEFIQINYSLDAASKVIYINRQRLFDNTTAPTLQATMASLVEKYGPASGREGGGSQPVRMYWASAPMSEGRSSITSQLHMCGGDLISDGGPFAQMRNGNINFNPQYIDGIWPRCGAVMIVKIDPLASNRQLVYSITAAIGDFKALQRSDHSMFDQLRRGEADKNDAGVKQGAANKAPL